MRRREPTGEPREEARHDFPTPLPLTPQTAAQGREGDCPEALGHCRRVLGPRRDLDLEVRPSWGRPGMLVKDLGTEVEGLPATGGSRCWWCRGRRRRPGGSGPVVAAVAGAYRT
ncbi:hypothetical protein Sdia_57110 [Streptomyces diastaticus subsp. diastaticus]|uniref:Uncharacterized protein n=1 Tax=Streptomyces diastaticus subsp. diastaticus TaxID=68040 RepID=A0ABQ1CXH5_STRDI|nr:hypothetical protein Sdia_57110 [Streptomyces diastaticus subsp. diastaticus]GGU06373.1 hypothetical protein GCM10015534_05790 [Streptomyces diastaticus subsp. diastaticus]